MPTMSLCPSCLKRGTHSRLKRVYYRLVGRYSEIGWLCPTCAVFTLDHEAFVDDANRIFGTTRTVKELKKDLAAIQFHIDIIEENERRAQRKLKKFEKERHSDEHFAE